MNRVPYFCEGCGRVWIREVPDEVKSVYCVPCSECGNVLAEPGVPPGCMAVYGVES